MLHRRRSPRLPDHDYSESGAYFVTMVTYQRDVILDEPVLAEIVHTTWQQLPKRFLNLEVDAFTVMPNHVHGIVFIKADVVGAIHELPLPKTRLQRRQMLLPKVVGYFKMNAAKHINLWRNTPGALVWQRNYYDHVIRDAGELNRVRQYILDNPSQWAVDRENPENQ